LNPDPFVEDVLTDIERRLRDAGKTALSTDEDENPVLYYHASGERDAYSVMVEVIRRKAGNQKFKKLVELYDIQPGDKFMFYKREDEIWLCTDKEYNYMVDPYAPDGMKMDPGWGSYNFHGLLCVNVITGEHHVFTCNSGNTIVQKATTLDLIRIYEKSQKELDKVADYAILKT
jgi:hypothetical protein